MVRPFTVERSLMRSSWNAPTFTFRGFNARGMRIVIETDEVNARERVRVDSVSEGLSALQAAIAGAIAIASTTH